jgi:hypothetical protein
LLTFKNMERRYFLPLLTIVYCLIVSLFSQSCSGSRNLPIQGEEGPSSIITIVQEEKEQTEIGAQVSIIGANQQQERERNTLPTIMSELWQYIFSYLNFEGVLAARAVNKGWNELITGYRETGVAGVENKPSYNNNTGGWVKEKEVNLKSKKLKRLVPATIPSFAFYHLMGDVRNLPRECWPYLQGTQVHTLALRHNKLKDEGMGELAYNLQGAKVHTLDLNGNYIGDRGAVEFALALQGTQVHTIYLGRNGIGDQGAIALSEHLQATQVHTVNLKGNNIGGATQQVLREQYPHIKWKF